jgi:hypothetical protein
MYTKHGYEAQYDEAAGELTYTYLRRVLHAVDAGRTAPAPTDRP